MLKLSNLTGTNPKIGMVNALPVNINPPSDSQDKLLNLLLVKMLALTIDGLMELKLEEMPPKT
jgi:hypothetical protein